MKLSLDSENSKGAIDFTMMYFFLFFCKYTVFRVEEVA